MTISIIHGDCLAEIPRLVAEGVVVDAVVTDPPYHLTATTARFGRVDVGADTKTSRRSRDRSDPAARLAKGFFGTTWDGGDVAFRPETWATVATILRPGGFLVAFGGTRTYHRLACAIEDGGFVIQDSVLDLLASDARVRALAETLSGPQLAMLSQVLDDLQPTGLLAWVYGTGFPKRRDMLKPSWEPAVLAYRPGGPRTMQVDECRIGTELRISQPAHSNLGTVPIFVAGGRGALPKECVGRWPANLVHDGSDEVLAAFPDSVGQQSDITGEEPSHKRPFVRHSKRDPSESQMGPGTTSYSDDDRSAARFFKRFHYSSKADLDDRWHSRHPTVKPVDLISYLVRLVTPPGGTFLDPFAGSGTAAAAAVETGRSAVLIEREESYVADIHERLASLRGEATRPAPARRARREPGGLMDILGEEG